jgi:hypothetical protein
MVLWVAQFAISRINRLGLINAYTKNSGSVVTETALARSYLIGDKANGCLARDITIRDVIRNMALDIVPVNARRDLMACRVGENSSPYDTR